MPEFNDYLEQCTRRNSKILLDTNLLLCFWIGVASTNLLEHHKRTEKFDATDFRTIHRILARFDQWMTLPNILTEAVNLSRQGDTDKHLRQITRNFIGFSLSNEKYIDSDEAASDRAFPDLGLTDSAILTLAMEERDDTFVLTDDAVLYQRLAQRKIDAFNYTYIQQKEWGLDRKFAELESDQS